MPTQYSVRKGDTLWDIAKQELGNAHRWPELARANQLAEPYLLFVGQQLSIPAASTSAPAGAPPAATTPLPQPVLPTANSGAASAELAKILAQVDRNPELRGAAVILEFPSGKAFRLRQSEHGSGLQTVVVARIELPTPADEPSWWARWNGVILNCGGAAVSWVGVGLSLGAEVPSLGSATPLVVMSMSAATATSAQCGLAIAKESSDDFAEYVESEDGEWVNYADVALDLISLAGGIGGAVQAVRGSSQLLTTSKYAKVLNSERKGRLLKVLQRMEKHDRDLIYFRLAVEKLVKTGQVADPALRGISNNIVRRSLPFITKSLRTESLAGIADVVGGAAATVSSYYGGVGSRNLGLVNVTISILQEPPPAVE